MTDQTTTKKKAASKKASSSKPAAKRKPGRPKGSKNQNLAHVVGDLPRCEVCDSTEHTPYENTAKREYRGTDKNGKPCTHVVFQRTKCRNCGQARIDKKFEYRVTQDKT